MPEIFPARAISLLPKMVYLSVQKVILCPITLTAKVANGINGVALKPVKNGILLAITPVQPKITVEFSRLMSKTISDSLPRNSDQWKALYKRRTTVERYFKRLKEDYSLEHRGSIRSSRAWYFRVFLASMCLHIDAWVKHQELDLTNRITQWATNSNPTAA